MFFMDEANPIMRFLTGITTLYAACEMVYFLYSAIKGSKNDITSIVILGSQTTINNYTDIVTRSERSTEEYSDLVQMFLFFSTLLFVMMYFDVYTIVLLIGYIFTIYWLVYFGAIAINILRRKTDLGYTKSRVIFYLFTLLIYLIGMFVAITTLINTQQTHSRLFTNLKPLTTFSIDHMFSVLWNNGNVIYKYFVSSPDNMAFMFSFSILSLTILYHSIRYVFQSRTQRLRDILVMSSLPKTSPRSRPFLNNKTGFRFSSGSHGLLGLSFILFSFLTVYPHVMVNLFKKSVTMLFNLSN